MRKKNDNMDHQGETAKGEILVYQSDDGKIRLDVRLERETLWMTQSDMAQLFQCSTDNISLHLKTIYDERDLDSSATTEEFSAVRHEGARQVQRKLTFCIIQNKLHFAATGLTAAELIQSRADHLLSNMGLTTWKGGEVRKTDVATAKNYLKEEEIDELNRIVTMWLDFAEDQAKRRKQVFMKDWEQKLDEFLRFNERRVLPDAGKVSKKAAEDHAKTEYEKFEVRRRKYKESLSEADYIKQLEEAARQQLTEGKPRGRKRRK